MQSTYGQVSAPAPEIRDEHKPDAHTQPTTQVLEGRYIGEKGIYLNIHKEMTTKSSSQSPKASPEGCDEGNSVTTQSLPAS